MSTQTASKSELGIHWESPVLMYACFLGGIVFSILHHVFNASLHGQSVLDDNEQQWVQRAGTAIAFLVKLLFTTATGTAYTQWFWYRMRESPKTLKIADILFGIVYQPFTFVYIRVWAHHLPLAFLAIVTWVLPFSAIITPGAITVKQNPLISTQPLRTQEANLTSGMYCGSLKGGATPFFDPCTEIGAITFTSVLMGGLKSVPHPDKNSNVTYSTTFSGPALTCSPADNTTMNIVTGAVKQQEEKFGVIIPMVIFAPANGWRSATNDSDIFGTPSLLDSRPNDLDGDSDDASRLLVWISVNQTQNGLAECKFQNATYKADFSLFSNGEQVINVTREALTPIAMKNIFPKVRNNTDLQNIPEWEVEPTAYVSLVSSFTGQVAGTAFYFNQDVQDGENQSITVNANAFALNNRLTNYLLLRDMKASDAYEIGSVFESILQNITLSARYGWGDTNFNGADKRYLKYISNITTDATYAVFRTEFDYKPRDLAIAYGVSAFVSAICVFMGTYAMLRARSSFSQSFSAVFRFVLGSELNRDVHDPRKGADPVPSNLKSIVLDFNKPKLGGRKISAPVPGLTRRATEGTITPLKYTVTNDSFRTLVHTRSDDSFLTSGTKGKH